MHAATYNSLDEHCDGQGKQKRELFIQFKARELNGLNFRKSFSFLLLLYKQACSNRIKVFPFTSFINQTCSSKSFYTP